MKDVNEIIKTLLENAKKFNLSYTNTTVHEKYEDNLEVSVDIRVSKYSDNPYGLINTIPQHNLDDILPKGDRGPL